MNSLEIEKKFLLKTLPPEIEAEPSTTITQGYLFYDDDEMRVRREGEQLTLTVKNAGAVTRYEWTTPIPVWVYNLLWPRTVTRRVKKFRRRIEYAGRTLEIDQYFDDLDGLLVMEIEFEDEATAEMFELPAWAAGAQDVTEDERYKNKRLATDGRPAV